MLFFGIVLVMSSVIAFSFALLGAWMILPFSGLEMLTLGTCLYLCARQAQHCEVITITADTVEIARGRRQPEQTASFVRGWSRVLLNRRQGWYPSRLYIGAHGRMIEVGRCLTEPDRRQLATELREAVRVQGQQELVLWW